MQILTILQAFFTIAGKLEKNSKNAILPENTSGVVWYLFKKPDDFIFALSITAKNLHSTHNCTFLL